MSFCFIILAAGNSLRFNSLTPKPYQKIGGKSLIEININKASYVIISPSGRTNIAAVEPTKVDIRSINRAILNIKQN